MKMTEILSILTHPRLDLTQPSAIGFGGKNTSSLIRGVNIPVVDPWHNDSRFCFDDRFPENASPSVVLDSGNVLRIGALASCWGDEPQRDRRARDGSGVHSPENSLSR